MFESGGGEGRRTGKRGRVGVRLNWNCSARGMLIYFTQWLHSDVKTFSNRFGFIGLFGG